MKSNSKSLSSATAATAIHQSPDVNSRSRQSVPFQTIIFDLDGTLIDTEPTAARAIQECFMEWKIQLNPNDASFVTGRTWESAFAYLFGKYELPIPNEEAKTFLMKRYRETLEKELFTVPGSVNAVLGLSQHFRLGLVSGSNRADILWALQKLKIQECFQVILGAEDYPRSKPQPDGYLKALSMMNSPAKDCLIFEDSTVGIASARAAGAWVVAVTSTNHFNQDHSLAHIQISDLTPVTPQWIQNLTFD